MPFIPRAEHELDGLDDEALVAHLRAARAAGDRAQSVLALQILVFGHWDNVKRRVALKVAPEDVEAVASDIVYSAVRHAAGFDGGSIGEFVSWLKTITARRIADHHRRREGEPRVVALVGADDTHEPTSLDVADRSQEGLVETRDVVDRVLASLSVEHAKVVERHVLEAVPAAQVGVELGVGADNVAQIASRFRKKLRTALQTSEAP